MTYDKRYLRNGIDGQNMKYSSKSSLKQFAIGAATLAAFAGALMLGDRRVSRIENYLTGSGKCYGWTEKSTKRGDNLWKLAKDIDARDKKIAIKLVQAENLKNNKLGRVVYNTYNNNANYLLPAGKSVAILAENDCSDGKSKSLDELIKNAPLIFGY